MLLCPICNKLSVDQSKPFCSLKCKQIDLLNWISEPYSISVSETIEDNNEEKL